MAMRAAAPAYDGFDRKVRGVQPISPESAEKMSVPAVKH